MYCTNSGLVTSDCDKSRSDKAFSEQLTKEGFLTGVGSTRVKHAPSTCRITFWVSLSIGRDRRAKLSNFSVSRVAITPRYSTVQMKSPWLSRLPNRFLCSGPTPNQPPSWFLVFAHKRSGNNKLSAGFRRDLMHTCTGSPAIGYSGQVTRTSV